MSAGSLQVLVDTARRMPGARGGALATTPWIPPAAAPRPVDTAALRRRTGEVLRALGDRAGHATRAALRGGWDQMDGCVVVDTDLHERAAFLREDWRDAAARGDAAARAASVEGQLALDAALALCTLLERRLSMLARLWLDAGQESLLPDGRPFLDVGAALTEAAEGWT